MGHSKRFRTNGPQAVQAFGDKHSLLRLDFQAELHVEQLESGFCREQHRIVVAHTSAFGPEKYLCWPVSFTSESTRRGPASANANIVQAVRKSAYLIICDSANLTPELIRP